MYSLTGSAVSQTCGYKALISLLFVSDASACGESIGLADWATI